MANITVHNYGAYNSRRYGRPWAAIITFNGTGRANYNFKAGTYLGNDEGGELIITAQPGDIIAAGQKDNRKPQNSNNDWYIVGENNELIEISRADAFKQYKNRQEA
jgi:hypothetical protein